MWPVPPTWWFFFDLSAQIGVYIDWCFDYGDIAGIESVTRWRHEADSDSVASSSGVNGCTGHVIRANPVRLTG